MSDVAAAQSFRLRQGGLIDRARPLRFAFEGRSYWGFEGDTLASALLANGVRIVGRSFKYHRPRGIVAAGAEEPNALLRVGAGGRQTPNLRATEIELHDGLEAAPQNCWPSVGRDVGGVVSLASRFLPAGFYYKTFMWPDWHLFEWAIRRAAGLGKAPVAPDPDTYDSRFGHCDVLVVGAGAAGLAAARGAARSNARIILAEQDFALGGRLGWNPARIGGLSGDAWIRQTEAELRANPNVSILTRTCVAGYFDHNALALIETVPGSADRGGETGLPRQRLWQIRAKQVVLATGAIERPMVFDNNDKPGVMLASAAHCYLGRFAVLPGRKAVVFTNNDLAYAAAEAFHDAGILRAVVDVRPSPPRERTDRLPHVPIFAGGEIVRACGTPLKAVVIKAADGKATRLDCDLLAMSGGFNPAAQLFSQSGGTLGFDESELLFRPQISVQAERSVGAAHGTMDLRGALLEGHCAGQSAARAAGFETAEADKPDAPETAYSLATISPKWRSGTGKAFVDFQNDVSVQDIALAARENFRSVEHLKRYTTLGMATDQGKTSNVNALAIMADLTGRRISEAGVIRDRFPYSAQSFGALASSTRAGHWRPQHRMVLHDWHAANGAVFEEYSGWARPAYYARAGETGFAAEQREALAVRNAAGLLDGSPLGKIEVKGPDAAWFLDRIYANRMSTLVPFKARYGLMLNENGAIIDDGIVARLAADHFLLNTSSAGAVKIASWLDEWRQCEWPERQLLVASVTSAWAVLILSGPSARAVLQRGGTDIETEPGVFPHMSYRSGRVGGVPARVLRASFTGEVSFEIGVAASHARELWESLIHRGSAEGIAPVGIDAWMLLRTEKGNLHVGADTDGTTSPDDVGFASAVRRADDFIGKRSLLRPENRRSDRLQFVGLEAAATKAVLPVGSHILGGPGRSDGYVTSAGWSPTLGRGVALAMLVGGRARAGETVRVRVGRSTVAARVTGPAAYDPAGERLHG